MKFCYHLHQADYIFNVDLLISMLLLINTAHINAYFQPQQIITVTNLILELQQ